MTRASKDDLQANIGIGSAAQELEALERAVEEWQKLLTSLAGEVAAVAGPLSVQSAAAAQSVAGAVRWRKRDGGWKLEMCDSEAPQASSSQVVGSGTDSIVEAGAAVGVDADTQIAALSDWLENASTLAAELLQARDNHASASRNQRQ